MVESLWLSTPGISCARCPAQHHEESLALYQIRQPENDQSNFELRFRQEMYFRTVSQTIVSQGLCILYVFSNFSS